jgi:iron complex outermembrane receptor protein
MTKASSRLRALLYGAALTVLAGAAQAQTTPPVQDPQSSDVTQVGEVVVTGTLIRGVGETGSNLITLNDEAITATGAARVSDVLADIPQVTSNFNKLPTYDTAGIMVNRPDIRNLTGASAASTTLVLMDGHRMTPVGGFSAADPDVIPPALLQRVEIVPDGGSSTYGADAVAGVLNFITKRRFDGVQVEGHYGVADNYASYDASITGGKAWNSGSIYGSYSYAHHDRILYRDRDYAVETQPNLGYCPKGTVYTSNGATVLAPVPFVPCSTIDGGTMLPEETRQTVFVGLNQDLSDRVTFDLTAFKTRRGAEGLVDLDKGRAEATVCHPLVGAACAAAGGTLYPAFASVGGELAQKVRFSFSDVQSSRSSNQLDVYQITPELKVKLDGDWQIRALGSWGASKTTGRSPTFDPAKLSAAVAAGTLNIYNVDATAPAVLQGIFANNYVQYKQELGDLRVIADGPLFTLPGGEARLAVGAEYTDETFEGAFQVIAPQDEANARRTRGDRNVKSAFAELNVPIVGDGNRVTLIHALTLSASARYDSYSDVGDTTNPRVGLTWQPVDWINVRTSWGESFTAPAMGDLHAPDSRYVVVPASDLAFLDPTLAGGPASPVPGITLAQLGYYLRPSVAVVGGNTDLKPQTAETFSAGFDVSPPVAPGLRFGVTYYKVKIKDQFNLVAGAITQLFTNPALASYYIRNPTLAQVTAIGGALPVDGPPLATVFTGAGPAYYIDLRRHNLGMANQDGLDFSLSYDHATGFGAVFAKVGGTYILGREESPIAGSPMVSVIDDDISRLAVSTSFGAKAGGYTGQVTWNHSAGYSLSTPASGTAGPPQTKVDGFDTVDLFGAYDFKGQGWTNDLSLTVNIGNLFDEDPPFYNNTQTLGSASGYINGGTLGRFLQVGLRKHF